MRTNKNFGYIDTIVASLRQDPQWLMIAETRGKEEKNDKDAFLSDCVRAVEEGNFQDSVISQCQTDAQKNNYELKCNKIDTNGDSYTDMVDMSLSYDYTIPFIHRDGEKHEIKAYAR